MAYPFRKMTNRQLKKLLQSKQDEDQKLKAAYKKSPSKPSNHQSARSQHQ